MYREPELPPDVPPPGVAVARALMTRRAVRAFLPTPVPRGTVESILMLAARAPSGTNAQPWKVTVCTGRVRDALAAELTAAHFGPPSLQSEEYAYYPRHWRDPYLARRRKLGWDLYGLLGIAKGDREASARQHARNFDFFGAPVGLFFTLDRDLEQGSWLDCGMFIQSVMIAARAYDLHTCPQAAFTPFHRIVRRHLAIPDSEIMLCGMALGHVDADALVNQLNTERESVGVFTRFLGD
ncbi:MAG TPA: nitroreductase [Casimicrobiaceae bacterium]|nr:nitroreductase [Casimicrobiaceae bacterium]